jgi:D-alanyl-D-alanine carboxypeptidase
VDLDEVLRGMLGAGYGPGLVGLVTDHDAVVWSGSHGTGSIAGHEPIPVDAHFRIGSVTKTYVAAATVRLEQAGALSVSDPVARWLPEYDLDAALTIEHLLRLRSGIPDYLNALFGTPPDLTVYQRFHAADELVRLALSLPDRTLPNAAFRYSNADYILLGIILERAAGARIDDVMRRQIFEPLALTQTTYPIDDITLPPPHARGYSRMTSKMPYFDTTEISPSESGASGAIVATPRDVARFVDATIFGPFLGTDGSAALRNVQPVADDRGYGYGLYRVALPNGVVAYGHQGGTAGFNTVAVTTETRRTAVVYTNGFDLSRPLRWDNPFVLAALAGD